MAWLKSPMLRLGMLFAVWGPWIGSLFFFGYDSLFINGDLTLGQAWTDLLIGTIKVYPFSLIFGAIPALLTGMVYAYYLKTQTVHNPNWKKRVLIGAVLGSVFSTFYFMLLLGIRDESIVISTALGILTGAICTVLMTEGVYYWLFPKRNPLYEQLQKQKALRM